MTFTDLTGRPVPLGRVRREYVYSALLDPALPSWLTVQSGTGAWMAPATSIGMWRVYGTARLALATSPPLHLNVQQRVTVTVEGLHWDAPVNPGLSLKDDAGTCGVSLFHNAAAATAVLRQVGAGVPDIPVPYVWTAAEVSRRRNLTLALDVPGRVVYLTEDDQVFAAVPVPSLRTGQIRAVVDSQPVGAGQREMRILQCRLAVDSN